MGAVDKGLVVWIRTAAQATRTSESTQDSGGQPWEVPGPRPHTSPGAPGTGLSVPCL